MLIQQQQRQSWNFSIHKISDFACMYDFYNNNCKMWQSRHVINLMHWHSLASQSLVDIVYWIMSSITQVTWELFSAMIITCAAPHKIFILLFNTLDCNPFLATFASRFNQKLVIYSSLLLGMEEGKMESAEAQSEYNLWNQWLSGAGASSLVFLFNKKVKSPTFDNVR